MKERAYKKRAETPTSLKQPLSEYGKSKKSMIGKATKAGKYLYEQGMKSLSGELTKVDVPEGKDFRKFMNSMRRFLKCRGAVCKLTWFENQVYVKVKNKEMK